MNTTMRPRLSGRRGGATLTEVLMGVMLMGIGVVTLATLFPISILKSIQASQLTNATILRYQSEAMLSALPEMVLDPDLDSGTAHASECFVFDPLGWNVVPTLPTDPNPGGDPPPQGWFGWKLVPTDYTMPMSPLVPGHAGDLNLGPGLGITRRYALFFEFVRPIADSLVTLQDSWITQFDAVPTFYQATVDPMDPTIHRTFVDLPLSIDLSNIPIYEDVNPNGVIDIGEDLNGNMALDSVSSRIHLFDANGRGGQVREITQIVGNRVHWDERDLALDGFDPYQADDRNQNGVQDFNRLPVAFQPQRVRVVTQDRRFTWLLTVRRDAMGSSATVNVVVFFKRDFDSPEGEWIYESDTTTAFRKDVNTVTINYNPAIGIPHPYLKRGSYVFDVTNCYWYRIQDYTDDTTNQVVTLTIDRPALVTSNTAMLMKGIVDVFPIGTKTLGN